MTSGRRGFALIASLVTVVLLGALIVGTFLATIEETRVTSGVRAGEGLLDAAESTVETSIGGWVSAQADSVLVGRRTARTSVVGEISVVTTLVRLDSTVYWLVGEATGPSESGTAAAPIRRRVGILLRRVADSTGRRLVLRFEERAWSELF